MQTAEKGKYWQDAERGMDMQPFMGKDFLLRSQAAVRLYHDYAAAMPIADYHCHINPKEVFEDKHFDNLFQVWMSGDHYKWRLMRSNGVDEEYITGSAPEREKFQKFAEALPRAIGNPMYHWCHLELQRYFDYYGVLNGDTAEEVWNLALEKLKQPDMGVRGLIEKSNVSFVGTTDDPVDSLQWHKLLKEDASFKTVVAPSFRPDKAVNLEKADFVDYIQKLSDVSGVTICDIASLKQALSMRIEHFHAHGCKASDHGLDHAVYLEGTEEEANDALKAALSGQPVTPEQIEKYKTNLLLFFAEAYYSHGWVMQIHYNCLRNPNSKMLAKLGPDTGFDCIGPDNGSGKIAKLLDALYRADCLPRTVLYSLDAGDNGFLATIIGAFQGAGVRGKLQHGSAWWFNDNKTGMRDQLTNLANLSILGNFIGMLTDSRSFLSYTRHEYFRRILCDLLGEWMENGEYPDNFAMVGGMVQDICYNNAKIYFNLEEKL